MKQRLTQAPYDRKQVGQDLSSGGIAAMSMLPFALAFGALAGIGMPAGLIAAVGGESRDRARPRPRALFCWAGLHCVFGVFRLRRALWAAGSADCLIFCGCAGVCRAAAACGQAAAIYPRAGRGRIYHWHGVGHDDFADKQLFRHQCNRRQRSGYAALLPQLWFSCKLEDSALWHNRAGADDYLSA